MVAETKTIGVISIKGGVGKTSCAINLGAALATEFNKKVLVIDANYSAPSLGLHLGVIKPDITLNEVFKKDIHISNAIHQYDNNLHIIPGSLIRGEVNVFQLKQKIEDIKNDYDAILIDSSPNLNEEMLSTIIASDELLVVTTPDYPTLNCTIHAIKVAREKKTPISGLILNKFRNKKFELNIEDIENACEIPVLAVLPDDVRTLEALALTIPVILHKPMSDISVTYKKLAACLLGQKYEDSRFFQKLKGIFRSQKPKDELNRLVFKNGRI
jgi:septum site-determining protein MinD